MTSLRDEVRDDVRATEGAGLRARLARWSARQLVAAWLVYWIGLLLYAAWPQLHKIWVLSTTKQSGSISLTYSGGALEAALWIAGPPLLLALVWIATRPPRASKARR